MLFLKNSLISLFGSDFSYVLKRGRALVTPFGSIQNHPQQTFLLSKYWTMRSQRTEQELRPAYCLQRCYYCLTLIGPVITCVTATLRRMRNTGSYLCTKPGPVLSMFACTILSQKCQMISSLRSIVIYDNDVHVHCTVYTVYDIFNDSQRSTGKSVI